MPKAITGRFKVQGAPGKYTYAGRHVIPPRIIHTGVRDERLAVPQDFYLAMPWYRKLTKP